MASDWKETLNLPKTGFPMKANLTQREPERLKRWEETDLYGQIIEARKDAPVYSFHDGPPYANGHIHLGHALNKILKDFVVKSRTMQGRKVVFQPGWDCHGLPIEKAIEKEKGRKVHEMEVHAFREACKAYAQKYIGIQREEFKRLGGFALWDDPYRTMDHAYEARIARSFCDCFLKGYVYKGLKPVLWCSQCGTALAEAEVEYADHTSDSIYVTFPFLPGQDEKLPECLRGASASVVIWTTTPWTLPANLAVAFHPNFDYVALRSGARVLVVGEPLLDTFLGETGSPGEILGRFKGAELEGLRLSHPFLERDSLCILADYVTDEQGTCCVHTAPGHGQEDFVIGQKYGLDILSPVDGRGRFVDDVEHFAGMDVFEANPRVVALLEERGVLLAHGKTEHSYPHCWRCKEPLIFRATQQWFIDMEHQDLRRRALEAIDQVTWVPPWGRNRIYGMVENRPDWCISRQRRWGVPISVVLCKECETPVRDPAFFDRVCAAIEEKGAGVWYEGDPLRFLSEGHTCEKCGSSDFEAETDILDVWFDSGVSHRAVLGHREEMPWPSELYLEGSDQHRGWFHTSLLTSMILDGEAPYRHVITHGFTLDGDGRAMSKSMGNVIAPEEVVKKFGAEILRLWVSMVDYRDDVRFSWDLVQKNGEAYLKIRNTLRYLLGNISDFEPSMSLPPEDLEEMDRYILLLLDRLIGRVTKAYQEYAFHLVYHEVLQFCSVTLSAFYLDILKDRLYCSAADWKERRSAQTVLYRLADSLARLLAPVLSFTADEVWEHLPGEREASVHMAVFPESSGLEEPDLLARWESLRQIRETVNKALEDARKEGIIGKSLEAAVVLAPGEASHRELLERYGHRLREIFITSSVEVEEPSDTRPEVSVRRAEGNKCPRCWTITTQALLSENGGLCPRCASATR